MDAGISRNTESIEADIEAQGLLDAGSRNLAYDIFIRTLGCPKLLRNCRLVCHSWNVSACAVLRNISIISFEEEPLPSPDDYPKDDYGFPHALNTFSKFVQCEDLPSPFKKISIEAKLLEASDFWDLIRELKLRNIEVTELEVNNTIRSGKYGLWNEKRCKCLANILECHQDALTSLKIYFVEDLPENVIHGLDKFRLINLKKLHIEHTNGGHGEVNLRGLTIFIENILRHSKLMELTINVRYFNMLKEILTVNQLNNVASLRVATIHLTSTNYDEIIQYFSDNPLPNLKYIEVNVNEVELAPLLFYLSDCLEVLVIRSIDSGIPLESFPTFQNLREMYVHCTHKGQFSPEKFPSLKKLTCLLAPLPRTSTIAPHFGLDFLHARIHSYGNDYLEWTRDHYVCNVCEKIEKLKGQFSKDLTRYFERNGELLCFTVATIRTMQDSFPNLKTLKLQGPNELNLAPGFQQFTLKASLRDELLLEQLVREIFPVEFFLSLETFYTNAQIAPSVIQYGISRIPKLKTFRFDPIERYPEPSAYRTEMLTAFRDYLGHLKEIQASGCREFLKCRNVPLSQLKMIELLPPGLFRYFCYCVTCASDQCGCIECDKFYDLGNPLF